MAENDPVSGRIRGIRRTRGMSQEALAEAAGLGLTSVKKVESGQRGEVSGATLRKIADGLGVEMTDLYAASEPIPAHPNDTDHRALAELRAALAPPVGLTGALPGDTGHHPIDLGQMDAAIQSGMQAYRASRYGEVADTLPGLIRTAHRAVDELGGHGAHRGRARILQLAGRYLTQVDQLDLATTALQGSIRDASAADDRTLAISGIIEQGWTLTCAGRLDEVERLCVATAEEVEPRMSAATREEVAMWGKLLLRAASAAVRNNASDRAGEIMALASAAAAKLGPDRPEDHARWGSFGTLSVAAREAEHALVEDHPDRTLEIARPLREHDGMSPGSWQRHRLDVAQALVLTRDVDRATGVMRELRLRRPEWLRRQRLAHEVVQGIMRARPRTLTAEQRALATLVRVDR